MELAKSTKVSVTVDDVANVVDLSEAANAAQVSIGVLLDVNVGQNRCGVEPDKSVIELAQAVESEQILSSNRQLLLVKIQLLN